MNQHVGTSRQLFQHFFCAGVLQVQRHGSLAAIDAGEVRAPTLVAHRRPAAVFVAFRAFDLDDGGAEIGQHLGAIGAGENTAKVDDTDTVKYFHGFGSSCLVR